MMCALMQRPLAELAAAPAPLGPAPSATLPAVIERQSSRRASLAAEAVGLRPTARDLLAWAVEGLASPQDVARTVEGLATLLILLTYNPEFRAAFGMALLPRYAHLAGEEARHEEHE